MNEQTVTVTATVPEGLYRVIAEGKVSYSISGIQTPTVANIRAYQESVTISGTTVTLPAQVMSFYTPSTNGFVIEEIYSPVVRLLPETNTALTNTSKFTTTLQKYCMPTVWQFWNRNL